MPRINSSTVLLLGCAFLCGHASAVEKELKGPPKNAVPIPAVVYNFDHDVPGKLPEQFTFVVAGEGQEIHWEIRDDSQAPSPPHVLAQSGKADPGDNFALAILKGDPMDRGEVAVRFKAMAGEEDQGAGIVWRYKDPKNYYVARASAKEDSCAVYRVKDGKIKLISEQLVTVIPYTWYELRVIFVDKNFTAFVNGELVVGGKDSTFLGAGQVGLWTKADSSIRFDDFRVSH